MVSITDSNQINEKLIENIREYIRRKTGKIYFRHIRQMPDNIQITCPYHKNGQESKPSASIRITENDRSYPGLFSCFTCHETKPLFAVVQDLLGELYNEDEVESLFGLKTLYAQNVFIEKPKQIVINFKQNDFVPKSDIKKLKYYHPYLAERGITEKVAEIYDLGFDSFNKHITFPIYDINHNCVGLGRRSITQKVYRYPHSMTKPLYGLYELDPILRYVYVVEGPFNLWSLRGWGKQGVALLGTGTEFQYKQLLDIKCKGIVLALDPDAAGRKGIYRLGEFLNKNRIYNVFVALLPDGKDINDLKLSEFRQVEIIPYKDWKKWYTTKILSS